MAQFFDYGKGEFSFTQAQDGIIQHFKQTGQHLESLLLTLVFGSNQQRDEILVEYIKARFNHESPLFTFMLLALGKVELIFSSTQLRENIMRHWNIHLAFIIENLDKLPSTQSQDSSKTNTQIHQVKRFILELSKLMLQSQQSVWKYFFLRLILNDSGLADIKETEFNSVHLDPSAHLFMSLVELLNYNKPNHSRNMVELSFFRAQLLSGVFGLHDLAHEELHFVVENRDKLQPHITKSQYFQFLLRHLKIQEFELSRKFQQPGQQKKN